VKYDICSIKNNNNNNKIKTALIDMSLFYSVHGIMDLVRSHFFYFTSSTDFISVLMISGVN